MTKQQNKKRKRPQPSSVPVALEVSGVSNHGDLNSIESCLEELEALNGGFPSQQELPLISHPFETRETTPTPALAKKQKAWAAPELTKENELWDHSLPTHQHNEKDIQSRVHHWNNDMELWMTRGDYTAGLLPCFELEVARHFHVQQLSSFLLGSCQGLKMPSFERWLIDANLDDPHPHSDPVLSTVESRSPACQRLAEEMRDSGMESAAARKIIQDLCRRVNRAINELEAQAKPLLRKVPFRKGERIELDEHGGTFCTLAYHNKRWKAPFQIKITKAHYEKLRAQFLRVHERPGRRMPRLVEGGKATRALHSFHLLVMTVVLRYSSLSGGQLLRSLKGGGMQGAVHGELFYTLRRAFPRDALFECFASPLNSYLASYCSAFYELDWHFGSVGDFVSQSFNSGCCQANPPFSPALMDTMVTHMESNLSEAERHNRALTFVVIVPSMATDQGGDDAAAAKRAAALSFRRMTSSPYYRAMVTLAAKEHGYVEGAQHLRPTRYKESMFETNVIVLQSARALKQSLPKTFEDQVRKAFTSRHAEELKLRQAWKGLQ